MFPIPSPISFALHCIPARAIWRLNCLTILLLLKSLHGTSSPIHANPRTSCATNHRVSIWTCNSPWPMLPSQIFKCSGYAVLSPEKPKHHRPLLIIITILLPPILHYVSSVQVEQKCLLVFSIREPGGRVNVSQRNLCSSWAEVKNKSLTGLARLKD